MKIDNLIILEEFWDSNTKSLLVVCKDVMSEEIKTFFGSYVLNKDITGVCDLLNMMLPELETKEQQIKFVIDYGCKLRQKQMKNIFENYFKGGENE